MTVLITFFALVGAIVGQRFRVYALIPMTLAALCIVVLITAVQGDNFWGIVITALLSAAGLQVGYGCGSFIRVMRTSSRDRQEDLAAPATTQTPA
jgi:hypothetical protein